MSKLRLAAYIALRIARSKRSTTLSIVTILSIVGLALGVMALMVVLAVTDGFASTFEDKILGVFPHLLVSRNASTFNNYEPVLETIRATEGVLGATPVTGDEMMVAHGVFRSGATVQGIDLPSVGSVLRVGSLMKTGRLEDLEEVPTLRRSGDGWHLTSPVEGMSLTVVAVDEQTPLVLVDDRIVPNTDKARIKLLDLRKNAAPTTLTAKGGVAFTIYEEKDPVRITGDGKAYGAELELPEGDWELAATGERFALEADQLHLIVLLDDVGGKARTIFSVEPSKPHLDEREALVRVVDARLGATGALTWSIDEHEPFATTHAGEHTGMLEVPAQLPGVLLGVALANKLKAVVGDELTFVTPLRGIDNKMLGPYGMLPSSAHFRVVGTFEAGFYDHDVRLAIVNLGVSQRFLNRGKIVRSLAVKVRSLDDLEKVKRLLKRALDPQPVDDFIQGSANLDTSLARLIEHGEQLESPSGTTPFVSTIANLASVAGKLRYSGQDTTRRARFQIFDWKEKNQNLFGALQLQKVVLSIFFFIIILVGSFVVVGSQIMVVHEKTPEIAILKTMGCSSRMVRLVFTLQGLLVALVGLGLGLALGLGVIGIVDAVDYKLDSAIYLIDHLPAKIEWLEVALVALGAVLVTLTTTQISAGRAAHKTIVAGLRQVD